MFVLSKSEPIRKVINGHTYKLTRWSPVTTNLEGFRLGMAVAPAFTMLADMYTAQKKLQAEYGTTGAMEEENMIWTGAFSQLAGSLTPEMYIDLQDKLFKSVQVIIDEEAKSIEDWSEHFDKDEYKGDWAEVLYWSFKENLWDFFMKQGIVASKIEILKEVASPLIQQVQEVTAKSTNEK